MDEQLIIDVGMHVGKDTEFYLAKGFRVVAVEADPTLVELVRNRLSRAIEVGRLKIYPVAISDHDGMTEFYVNLDKSDWGTLSKGAFDQKVKQGTRYKTISVECVKFEHILTECGIPYYLKIDIEGADHLCLDAMRHFDDRPKFVSFEEQGGATDTLRQLGTLSALGYRDFKVVNQAENRLVRCPNPPLEGRYVDAQFGDWTSGPFGEEAPGEWMPLEQAAGRLETVFRWRAIVMRRRRLNTAFRMLHDHYRKIVHRPTVDDEWYDIHARQGERSIPT